MPLEREDYIQFLKLLYSPSTGRLQRYGWSGEASEVLSSELIAFWFEKLWLSESKTPVVSNALTSDETECLEHFHLFFAASLKFLDKSLRVDQIHEDRHWARVCRLAKTHCEGLFD